MDTSYFFPDIQRQQLLGQQAEGAGLENQFNQSAMPLNYELLRQKVLEGQLGLAGAQQQYAFNSAIMGRIMGGLQPQPNAYDPSAPQQAPSATGGGGSSGGSGGNNASASPGTSPSSSVNGAAPGSQGAPGFGGGGPQHEIGSVLGMDPDTQAAIALINPTMGKQLQESRDAQVKTLQLQAQGHINDLETVRNAANPGALVMANPGFRAQWATMAPHFGIDPNDPTQMTPANVQAVFGALANQTRGQVGLPAQKYEQFGPMQTGAAGEKYQVESGSGKVNQVSGEALKQVVGPNGLPQYATADQAAGRQPFNPTIFGAANMSDNTVDTLAAMARANGGKLPASLARNPLMQAKVLERMADQAKANGEDGAAIVYAGNARKANAGALDNLTKLQTATNAYSDTLDKNLSSLLSAAKAA